MLVAIVVAVVSFDDYPVIFVVVLLRGLTVNAILREERVLSQSLILKTSESVLFALESLPRLFYVVNFVHSVTTFVFLCTDLATVQSHFLPCGHFVFT